MAEGDPRSSEVGHLLQAPIEQGVSKPLSFSAIVQGKTHLTIGQKDVLQCYNFIDPSSITIKTSSDHHGKPSINFTASEKLQMVEKLKWVLVGKFSHGRPPLAVIKAFFQDVKLQSDVNFAFADSKHIFIECSGYLDYYFIWMHLVWNIHGHDMRMFKWNSNFSVLVESPIAPVWIRLEGLALYLFDEITLLSIASTLGKPIKVDPRNVNRSCLSSARICIELDVSKPLIDAIWISIVDEKTGAQTEGMWAHVFYDVVPDFCSECSHIGHRSAQCKRKKESSSGARSSGLSHSTIPTTVVHWQGVQNTHKKVWKQVGIRQTAQVSSTEFIGHEVQGVQVGESTCSPITLLSGSQQIREANLKGQEQIPAYKSSTSAEVPNYTQQEIVQLPSPLSIDVAARDKIAAHADVEEKVADHDGDFGGRDKAAKSILQMVVERSPKLQIKQQERTDYSMPRLSETKAVDISTELDEAPDQEWQLVTGKRSKRSNKAQTQDSNPFHNLELLQTDQHFNATDFVVPTEQVSLQATPGASFRVVEDRKIAAHSTELLLDEEQTRCTLTDANKEQIQPELTAAQEGDDNTVAVGKDRYMNLEEVDVFADIIVPLRAGSTPASPGTNGKAKRLAQFGKSKRLDLQDNRELVHIKEKSEDTSNQKTLVIINTQKKETPVIQPSSWADQVIKEEEQNKGKHIHKDHLARQMVEQRIKSLCARINKMKRDGQARRRLLAELEDLKTMRT